MGGLKRKLRKTLRRKNEAQTLENEQNGLEAARDFPGSSGLPGSERFRGAEGFRGAEIPPSLTAAIRPSAPHQRLASRSDQGFRGLLGDPATETPTKKLILSGLLATLSFLLFCLTLVPVVQIIAVVVTPVPITLVGLRYGTKLCAMSSLVGAALVSMLLGPLQGYFFISLFAVVGLVTSMVGRKTLSPVTTLVAGTAILMVFNLLFYYGVERTLGLDDFIKEARIATVKAVDWTMESIEKSGFFTDPASLKSLKAQARVMRSSLSMWLRLPLFIFVVASFASLYLNHMVGNLILRRMGMDLLAPLPPFFMWRAPRWLALLLVFSFLSEPALAPRIAMRDFLEATVFSGQSRIMFDTPAAAYALESLSDRMINKDPGLPFLLLMNLKLVLVFAFYFFGLSVVLFWLLSARTGVLTRLGVVGMSLLFHWVLAMIGMADSFADFRGFESKAKST